MKKPFSFTELLLKILRISIGIAIVVSIVGYYIDVSQTSTIVIQGIPEYSDSGTVSSEAAPAQTSAAAVVSQTETPVETAQTDIPEEVPAVTTAAASSSAEYSTTAPVIEQSVTVISGNDAKVQQSETSDTVQSDTSGGLININTASAAELMELDGIGEVKAAAIVEYRSEHGEFGTVDDLMNVKGIGEKTLEKNRDRITVN